MALPVLHIFENDKIVSSELCKFVIEEANKAIQKKGSFSVGLSGGSLAKFLSEGLPSLTTDWSKWHVFFCDERHVPFDDVESTYKFYKENLFGKVSIPDEQIYKINPNVSVTEAATEYIAEIRKVFPGSDVPRFDMLLLGMGPDGHTCSLFPNHELLSVNDVIVAPISDSPKPPPRRITMTYPLLNNAVSCVFASCGSGKAQMVKRILEGNDYRPLPAGRVRLTDGRVYWYLDSAAAELLDRRE